MAVKDIAYAINTFLISRKHGFTAGVADGVGDICNVLSIGLTAILAVHQGFTAHTVAAFVVLLAGSIVGGWAGTKLGELASARLEE